MARYDKSRTKRPKQDAAVAPARPRTPTHRRTTRTRCSSRACASRRSGCSCSSRSSFGLGFVGFGVGAGGVGVGDIFRGSGGTGAQSVSDARGETEDRPRDAEAWRDLATAYETEGDTAEAVAALDTAVELAPRDASSLRRLAGLRLALASERQQDAQLLQIAAVYRAPSQVFPGLIGTAGQPIAQDPLASAVDGLRHGAHHGGTRRTRAPRRPRRSPPTSGSSRSSPTTRTSSSSSPRPPSRPGTRPRRSARTRRS